MDILKIEEYLIIEKKDKSGIAISIEEVPQFSFEQCSCMIESGKLILEPVMYSSNYIVEIELTSDEHFKMLSDYEKVTIAQIKADSSFGDIFEIEISK